MDTSKSLDTILNGMTREERELMAQTMCGTHAKYGKDGEDHYDPECLYCLYYEALHDNDNAQLQDLKKSFAHQTVRTRARIVQKLCATHSHELDERQYGDDDCEACLFNMNTPKVIFVCFFVLQ